MENTNWSSESEKVEESGIFSDSYSSPHPFSKPKNRYDESLFTFIDLFAGIGGFRMAMQNLGGKCVFSSEWDSYAQKTYFANYGEVPYGDIRKEDVKAMIPPSFDILCAGFPCQPFSIAGVSKKRSLGRQTGFRDKTQGTLFFEIATIVEQHRPKILFLENVKNLLSHDKGRTYTIIKTTLQDLNYTVFEKVLNGNAFTPQNRERIFIVAFDKNTYGNTPNFVFPDITESDITLGDILDYNVSDKYTLSNKLWNYLQRYAEKHKAKGNGFGFGLAVPDGKSRTLSARYYKDGSEILIPQPRNLNPRRLTPRECARLMGYPDSFIIDAVSETQMYKQLGNSVVVPLVQSVGEKIVEVLLAKSR